MTDVMKYVSRHKFPLFLVCTMHILIGTFLYISFEKYTDFRQKTVIVIEQNASSDIN